MPDIKHHGTLTIERLQNSPNGNPRWAVFLDRVLVGTTAPNSSLGLRIDNHAGRRVVATQTGRYITEIHPA